MLLSILGSLALVSASVVRLTGPSDIAHKLALGGCLGMYFFYLPVTIRVVRTRLRDQRLELTVVRWTEGGTSLEIEDDGPQYRLRPDELEQVKASGVRGRLSDDARQTLLVVEFANGGQQGFGVWWPQNNPIGAN